jgi:hypothetical protein
MFVNKISYYDIPEANDLKLLMESTAILFSSGGLGSIDADTKVIKEDFILQYIFPIIPEDSKL